MGGLFFLAACGGSGSSSNTPPPPPPPPPCPSCADSIARENKQPGSPDWVLHSLATKHEIEGFAGATSVNRGGNISFYVNTASPSYTIQFYRLGWYGGVGARAVSNPVTLTGQAQPACGVDPATYLMQCPWALSYTLTVPSDNTGSNVWISGMYVAKLIASDTQKDRYITFVVRDDASTSDLIFNFASLTYAAYNSWGGKSLYAYNSSNGVEAYKVSFDRPDSDFGGGGYFFQLEYNALRYLERNGYYVTYATDVDLHEGAEKLSSHKGFLSMGHNEYWTLAMRTAVENAKGVGVSLGFFNGNSMEWQARLEPSTLTKAADRTVVEYRDPTVDPYNNTPSLWPQVTTEWRNPPVNNAEEAVLGEMFSSVVLPNTADYIVQDGSSWIFAGTGLATGSHIPTVVGREVDHRFTFLPGVQAVAKSGDLVNNFGVTDYGEMTIYQSEAGSWVFDAGSLIWPLTLDKYAFESSFPNYNSTLAQQITANVLQKFGASPH